MPIPQCDSVYITKPNDNICNLIQRMSRSNRIMNNKSISNIFIWTNSNNKIFEYINNFIDSKYSIQFIKFSFQKSEDNSDQLKIIQHDHTINTYSNTNTNPFDF